MPAEVKKVDRPKLSLVDKMYIKSLAGGLLLTLGHAFRAMAGRARGKEELKGTSIGVTMQFPDTTWDDRLPEYYRGAPTLVTDESGRERCVSCQLCEFICPPKAITITPGEIPEGSEWQKVEKAPKEFEIDMIRCIYCGLCQEVCPEQAIFLRKDYLFTGYSREQMVHNKKKLLELGGVKTGLVNKWNKLK